MNNLFICILFILLFLIIYFFLKNSIAVINNESLLLIYLLFCSAIYYVLNTELVVISFLDGNVFVQNDKFSDFVQLQYSFTEILGPDNYGSYGKFKEWDTIQHNVYLNNPSITEKLTLFPVVNIINISIAHVINISTITIENFYFLYMFCLVSILIRHIYIISKSMIVAISAVGFYPLFFAIETGNHLSIIVTLLLGQFFIQNIIKQKPLSITDAMLLSIAISIRPNLIFLVLVLCVNKYKKESFFNISKTFLTFVFVNLISYILVLLNYPKYKFLQSFEVFLEYSGEINVISNSFSSSFFRFIIGVFNISDINLIFVQRFTLVSIIFFIFISILMTYMTTKRATENYEARYYLFIFLYVLSITISNPIIMYHFLLFAYFLLLANKINYQKSSFIIYCLFIILLPKIFNNPYLPFTSWGLYFNQISFISLSIYLLYLLSFHTFTK